MDITSIPILVVDDDALVADMLVDLLQMCGAKALAVYSGLEALQVLDTWQPKAILLDIRMPVLDGYETAKAIRSRPAWESVAILALSGWHGDAWRSHTGKPLFDRYLNKPAELDIILQAVHGAVSERAIAA